MKSVFVQTFGCQMNASDSERMKATLAGVGYEAVGDPFKADLVLINTCSVREGAEDKLSGYAQNLQQLKKNNPHAMLGVTGCVAQQEKNNITQQMPFVDLVLGPDNIDELPWAIEEITQKRAQQGHAQLVRADFDKEARVWSTQTKILNPGPTAFVSVMKGCDHFCSYCIVPHTRGREKSRPMADVIDDVKTLVSQGVKEVTLLGQNINTYGKRANESLHELFHRLHDIEGLQRLRFTTSHPGDLKDELIRCFETLPKLCSSFHLPFQSGSNRILREMRRFYTKEQYLERVRAVRQARPDIAFSTDIIVGFPGETDEDIAQTWDVCEQVRFDNAYSFMYSARPGTAAALRPDQLSESVMLPRLEKLQARLRQISLECHQAMAGQTQEVLIEGPSKKDASQWTGRNSQNVIVHFARNEAQRPGDMVKVFIREGRQTHLRGETVSN